MRTSQGMLTLRQLRNMAKKTEKRFGVKIVISPLGGRSALLHRCKCEKNGVVQFLDISWRAITWGWHTYWEYDDWGNPEKECRVYKSKKSVFETTPVMLDFIAERTVLEATRQEEAEK